MLFKILNLFGLDVPAKIAATKAEIEQRVEDVTGQVKQTAQTAAIVVALSAFAGLFLAMAIGVGLIALYHVVADAYGVNAGLAAVAAVLLAAAIILALVAAAKGRTMSGISFSRRPATTSSVGSAARAPRPVAERDTMSEEGGKMKRSGGG